MLCFLNLRLNLCPGSTATFCLMGLNFKFSEFSCMAPLDLSVQWNECSASICALEGVPLDTWETKRWPCHFKKLIRKQEHL